MSHTESMPPTAATSHAASAYPKLSKLRVKMSIASREWTIWPGPPETIDDFIIGFPLELHPFAWDYLRIWSKPEAVTIQPHYRESSWDTFWIDRTGHVTCHALMGLFPFTLGRQPELLEGLRATIRVLPPKVESQSPDAARALVEIEAILDGLEMHLRTIRAEVLQHENEAARAAQRKTVRGRAAERFWEWKRQRSIEGGARRQAP